jgi:glycosyltransferase involved in cell wall biosynthesis
MTTTISTQSLVILHTESHRSWGGQESRVFNECLWMQKKGHRPLLAAPEGSPIYSRASAAGLSVLPMRFTSLSAVADLFRLRTVLKRQRPHVLNTHGNMDAKVGLLAACGLGIPCVIRSRHHSHPVSPSWYNKVMYRHLSDYIFTTAGGVTRQIVTDLSVDPSKAVTVASGIIPPGELPERQASIKRLQAELKVGSDTRFVGSVAMLRDWKGHRFLVEGFADIRDQLPNYHLVILGDGDEMEALKRQREQLGLNERMHLMGFHNDPWPYFAAFDLNVLASIKNEGIPQALLQAMYVGCPVIGTRAGGIPDIVEHGRTGLLVEPGSSAALAAAMLAALTQPASAHRRAQRAYAFVRDNHTIDVMGAKILGLYENALRRHQQ